MRRWIVVCETYEDLEAEAVDLLTAEIGKYVDYIVPVISAENYNENIYAEQNAVFLKSGKVADGAEEGYLIEVDENGGKNAVKITANTKKGLFYGTIDFIAIYVSGVAMKVYPNVNLKGVFDVPFNCIMPAFRLERAPLIKNRGIWTWGHCIFDYEKFFGHMSLLKLNEIVIWNDFMPVNAKKVVNCAHSYGIRVIWGFPWGWDNKCCKVDIRKYLGEDKISAFADKTLGYFEENILPAGGDGIYFQSFTEVAADNIDGVNVAGAVTKLVNDVAGKFYEKYPSLEIQFGLHATSVNTNLDEIGKVDKRIKIVWEDCGAFPYAYNPSDVQTFEKTQEFSNKITRLRGETERFGCVYKGMTTLYWAGIDPADAEDNAGLYDVFEHIKAPFVLGKNSEKELNSLYENRLPYWKYMQAEWIKNADCVREMTEVVAKNTKGGADVQLLVEYGAFEKEIMFPTAFAAECLWETKETTSEIVERVMLNPEVKCV